MPTREEITAGLNKVLASAEFVRARRMSRFLRFVVEATLAQETDNLKERLIGIEVFDQPADWDPKLNNIVRGEARRLRSKLDFYYETFGSEDPVRISIPKGGYAAEFTALHRSGESLPAVAEDVEANAIPSAKIPSNRRSWRFGAIAVVLGSFLAVFSVLSWHGSAKAGEQSFEVTPFANEIGQEFSPAVSPDNQRIAYVWDGNGDNYDIYVKEIQTGALSRLTHDPSPDLDPAWSPDGAMLAFLPVLPDRVQVLAQAASGGPERVIAETASPISGWGADSNPYSACYGPAWSSDGSSLVVSDHGTSGNGFALVAISLRSGVRTELTHPSGEARDICPHFSPDGHKIAFIRIASHGIADIHLLSQDGSNDQQLTFDGRAIQGLDWMRDGDAILFSSLQHGSYELREISATRNAMSQQLPVTAGSVVDPSIAASGSWLAFTELEDNWNIWRAPLTAAGVGKPELFLSSTGKNHSPSYSPDGKQIVFVSDRSGSPELWLSNEDGHQLKKLTNFGGPWLGSIRWSPDGKQITFDARPHGHSGIYTMPLASGEVVPVKENPYEERRPTWSNDGQAIYFNSNRDGNLRIWKRVLKSGDLQPIGPEGTNESVESPDGRDFYFTNLDYELWRSNPDGSEARPLPVKLYPAPGLDWSLGPGGIYFASDQDGQPGFFFYNFSKHSTTMIGRPERAFAPGTPSLVVSPDGKWILYAQMDHVSSDIKIRRSTGTSQYASNHLQFRGEGHLTWKGLFSSADPSRHQISER